MAEAEVGMIERVAMAIYKVQKHDRHIRWEDRIPGGHIDNNYMEMANLAIEAMRDPSKEMTRAIFEAMFEEKFDGTSAPMIAAGWDAGVDAALKE
ncbi:hypothetical protein GFL93_12655 [Rhizobium leguminosarum bv. viciae]|uniref:hypothetical protein n=1 Tax=Rhizobium TaxID=379 RepID=UPI001442456A|nr:hypothetical protein [Rhizobium leguminosarum]NKK06711.1 hypothetical protein [Rhizobium leguminosarum bv. viciae]